MHLSIECAEEAIKFEQTTMWFQKKKRRKKVKHSEPPKRPGCQDKKRRADLPTCTDFRGTNRFWPSITISRFHAVVYRFWKMREIFRARRFRFVFAGIPESSPHLAPTASQGAALPL